MYLNFVQSTYLKKVIDATKIPILPNLSKGGLKNGGREKLLKEPWLRGLVLFKMRFLLNALQKSFGN